MKVHTLFLPYYCGARVCVNRFRSSNASRVAYIFDRSQLLWNYRSIIVAYYVIIKRYNMREYANRNLRLMDITSDMRDS